MNIGIISRHIEDIKTLLDLQSSFKSNYYYCLYDTSNDINNIINYLINNNNIDILIILDSNVNDINKNYNKLLILNINDILFNYINDFDYYNNMLIITDKKITNKNINTYYINDEKITKKYVDNTLIPIFNKYKYVYCTNNKIYESINEYLLDNNIIKNYIPIKYLLNKYAKENIDSNITIYTTLNKENVKEYIKKKYNYEIDVYFINNNDKYLINIDKFSGPLDLLLHLIKESNIDIYNINIADITDQYMKYIKSMEELNLSIASSYLIMASELMYLKSKMLLPRNQDNEIEDEEELTKEELINRLIEYKKYKEVSSELKEMEEDASKYLTKLPTIIKCSDKLPENEYDINSLVNAFNNFLKRKSEDIPLNVTVTKKEYSVNKRCNSIKNILMKRRKIRFSELFNTYNKPYIIVSFLSILELLKKNEIYLIQNNIFDNIEIGIRDDIYE